MSTTKYIFYFILLLIVWERSFSMLPSVKFAEDKVLIFNILCEKMLKKVQLKV